MGEKMTCPGRTAQGRRPDQNKDEWSTDREAQPISGPLG